MSSSPRSPKRRRTLASINPPESSHVRPDDYSRGPDVGTIEDDARPRSSGRGADDDYSKTAAPSLPRSQRGARSPSREEPIATATGAAAAPSSVAGDADRKDQHRHAPSKTKTSKFRFKSAPAGGSRSRRRSRSRSPCHDADDDDNDIDGQERSHDRPRRRPRHRGEDDGDAAERDDGHRHHSSHQHHHHRRRRRHRSPTAAPAPRPVEAEEEPAPLDPEAAFRESLFDAMADDEGAAYWEGVYGQPIHVYAADRERGSGGPGGELERMTDDEYAAYVRQKMWEKTHAGAIEERARRARERDAAQLRQEEGRRIQAEIERSLRRGEQRRKRRVWTDRWDGYLARWAAFAGAGGGSVGVDVPQASSGAAAAAGIPWPVDRADGAPVDEQSVRVFFVNGLGLDELGEKESAARLKDERVRWHPDKMQQRLGGHVDAATMRDVTAIFQAIDALWNDSRKSAA